MQQELAEPTLKHMVPDCVAPGGLLERQSVLLRIMEVTHLHIQASFSSNRLGVIRDAHSLLKQTEKMSRINERDIDLIQIHFAAAQEEFLNKMSLVRYEDKVTMIQIPMDLILKRNMNLNIMSHHVRKSAN
jgi:hypothetical protein